MSKIIKIFYLLLLFVLLFEGCSDSNKKVSSFSKSPHSEKLHNPDSNKQNGVKEKLRYFQFQGKTIGMKASISFSEGYRKFQELLKQPLDKLFFNKTKFIDVTGDGILDTCISRIVIKKGEPKITHIILSGGEKIWEDTLTIDDDTGYELYWNYDSSYFKLKPYSGFQIASDLFSTFVMERIDTSSQHFKLISDIIYDLLSKENKKDKIYWQSYLGSFKGRLISKMDEVDIIAYIWDKRYKKFVLYYAP